MSNKLLILLFFGMPFLVCGQNPEDQEFPSHSREFYVASLVRIADPLLSAISKDQLKLQMPVERSPGAWDDRTHVTYLEGFGRLLSGMAPWLELGPDDSSEGKLRKKYLEMARKGITNATNPEAADYMNFTEDRQPLVDAAFLAQALLRAPTQLWDPLPAETKQQVIKSLKATRSIEPYYSNWLLFSSMIEATLLKFDDSADDFRLQQPIRKHMEWYLGDGTYGDGPDFHWDYYNSFVIQPMLLDILKTMNEAGLKHEEEYEAVLKRAKRYAEIQERLISPEGTYPPIGRSLAYRFGAFQLLSQIALWEELPEKLEPSQVRGALQKVIFNQLNAPGTFDENGWLQIGFFGHQPSIGEGYISTGSLYLCSEAFLVLGLPENNRFWTDEAKPWTQKKIWNGQNIPIDKAEK
ncbi:MAG: DUF2264 domain-containing protein [Christiangramia sp.]|uniref:DUF2264 domain-containing protein n=1 Tax=Christiangramia sp. TaxID=1931228 RepID=UPI0032429614